MTSVYVCTMCRALGPYRAQCDKCSAWHAMRPSTSPLLRDEAELSPLARSTPAAPASSAPAPTSRIRRIARRETPIVRMSTGLRTFDVALGGGLVEGSTTILGGEGGVGKSTLLLHMATAIASERPGQVLYVETEESAEMVDDRATRIAQGIDCAALHTVLVAELAAELAAHPELRVVLVNSIHGFQGDPFTIATELRGIARNLRASLLATSHIVKDGSLAGPERLKHDFDTVLRFELTETDTRILVVEKSRFAPSPRRFLMRLGDAGWSSAEDEQTAGSESTGPDSPSDRGAP